MRKIITMVLFILLGLLGYHMYTGLFITEVKPDKIFIRRPDSILNYTDYSCRYFGGALTLEIVYKFQSLGTSIRIVKDSKAGIYEIHYENWQRGGDSASISREPFDGSITVTKNGVDYYQQPYEKYAAYFEDAEKLVQETRARFFKYIIKYIIEREFK